MIDLTIDGRPICVAAGTTVMEAARQLGITIPSMCHNGDLPHFTSCMICLVKNLNNNKLITSCSVAATSGMQIITLDDEIREARKTAVELLLSDHVGDCQSPCQISCPAHMDIPAMNKMLEKGAFDDAYRIVLEDIALPIILGYICPAPCESACRRKAADQSVSICLLKRFAGEQEAQPGVTEIVAPSKARVAIIGSGPHGLSAAWYLQRMGYSCTVFDTNPLPGGALRYSIPRERLPEAVLDREIARIKLSGVEFEMDSEIGPLQIKELEDEYDAVVYPLDKAPKMAVKACVQGKEDAWKVHQWLTGKPVTGLPHGFSSRFGRLQEPEVAEYMKESHPSQRLEPAGGFLQGFTRQEAMEEAARCWHCECRKPNDCLLRIYANEYGADQKHYSDSSRKRVSKQWQHDRVVYEPQKCIKCGICVRMTKQYEEPFGLTFIGRGFDVMIGVPFSATLRDGLTHSAEAVVNACPTGALAFKGEKS